MTSREDNKWRRFTAVTNWLASETPSDFYELNMSRRTTTSDILPVCREQAFLESIFLLISQFDYDKAKDHIDKEKEKESGKTSPNMVWISMLSCLSQFDVAEKTYTSLLFLLPKGFLRKDTSLKTLYEALRCDLRRIEDMGKTAACDSLEKLLAHLCGQLTHLTTARLQLTDFYEHACSMGANRQINFEELLSHIGDIYVQHQKNFHHPSLGTLKSSFSFECEVLIKLMEAQLAMQQMVFLSSILHLHDAHSKLGAWEAMVQPKESRRGLSFTNKHPIPALYSWLWKFKGVLVSKFTLYFYNILSKQTTTQEMKSVCSRASVDFYAKLVSFQRKTDAKYVLLIFDATECEQFKGHGYQHPDKFFEPFHGLENFPAIVCYPGKPSILWPNIVMIMTDRATDLNSMEKVVCFFDKTMQMTYFLTRVEPRVTFVVIYDSRKSEKDSHITNFMSTFTGQLKNNRILVGLKPGSKHTNPF